jgi:hypothetical protein
LWSLFPELAEVLFECGHGEVGEPFGEVVTFGGVPVLVEVPHERQDRGKPIALAIDQRLER